MWLRGQSISSPSQQSISSRRSLGAGPSLPAPALLLVILNTESLLGGHNRPWCCEGFQTLAAGVEEGPPFVAGDLRETGRESLFWGAMGVQDLSTSYLQGLHQETELLSSISSFPDRQSALLATDTAIGLWPVRAHVGSCPLMPRVVESPAPGPVPAACPGTPGKQRMWHSLCPRNVRGSHPRWTRDWGSAAGRAAVGHEAVLPGHWNVACGDNRVEGVTFPSPFPSTASCPHVPRAFPRSCSSHPLPRKRLLSKVSCGLCLSAVDLESSFLTQLVLLESLQGLSWFLGRIV